MRKIEVRWADNKYYLKLFVLRGLSHSAYYDFPNQATSYAPHRVSYMLNDEDALEGFRLVRNI